MNSPAATKRPATIHNRLGLDYRAEAARLGPPIVPIIDCHTHINGDRAAAIYREARELFGVVRTYSMSQLPQADSVVRALGDTVRFIAFPQFMAPDRRHAMKSGYIDTINQWHALGARMVKWWCSPRGRDYGRELGEPNLMDLDTPWKREQMDHAASLGMMFMAHIADPDTYFQTKYRDASIYGTKADQYEPLERLADEYRVQWIIAHMGGWPEDLAFLDGLLTRHSNLHLDTSATKWMVRELSRHAPERFIAFLEKWRGRILFGSDIVVLEDHLKSSDKLNAFKGAQANTPEEAFDLYASRYYTLRTFFETDYAGPSPIADEDLKMVDPSKYDDMSAPDLRCRVVPMELRKVLYHDAAGNLIEKWWAEHP